MVLVKSFLVDVFTSGCMLSASRLSTLRSWYHADQNILRLIAKAVQGTIDSLSTWQSLVWFCCWGFDLVHLRCLFSYFFETNVSKDFYEFIGAHQYSRVHLDGSVAVGWEISCSYDIGQLREEPFWSHVLVGCFIGHVSGFEWLDGFVEGDAFIWPDESAIGTPSDGSLDFY